MIRIDIAKIIEKLNDECRHALEESASLAIAKGSDEISVEHILYKLAENPLSDLRSILRQANIHHEDFMRELSDSFVAGQLTNGQYPAFSPLLLEVMQEAWLLGSLENGHSKVRSGAVFLVVLVSAARYLPLPLITLLDPINRETLRKQFTPLLANTSESEDSSGEASVKDKAGQLSENGENTPLASYGIEFTERARNGHIDPVLCRDDEIDQMIDILSRRRKNNPIAVGDAGVGKSALIEGLALRIVDDKVPEPLRGVALWGLDIGALQAGASVKGEFEKRLKAVIDQVKNSEQPIILFIDEAHTLIGAGNQAGGSDAANLLKPELARGELRVIAATTWSEYKKYFEKDAALSRRFQLVKLDEPSIEQAVHILRGLRSIYEKTHRVFITDNALLAAAAQSSRYLSGRQLPDKAIDVLDTAAARVATALQTPPRSLVRLENQKVQAEAEIELLEREQRYGRTVDTARIELLGQQIDDASAQQEKTHELWQQQKNLIDKIIDARQKLEDPQQDSAVASESASTLNEWMEELQQLQREHALLSVDVDESQISQVIADWTGIPVNTISGSSLERLRDLDTYLNGQILGQSEAVSKIHNHMLTAMADLKRPGTPLGAFLLIGPSGVGKTETATQIADRLFGGKQFMTTINMSEYQEKHSLSRLIGSPPGYVGYGEGGVLSEAIRQRPYSVVLLDEVEKAHPDVFNLFYQAFDKGEFADGEGRLIDCKNNVFFLTSNLGFDQASSHLLDDGELSQEQLDESLRNFFKPALLARMQTIRFAFLDQETIANIVLGRLEKLQKQFAARYKAPLQIDDSVKDMLCNQGVQRESGARMLDATIEGKLLPPLSLQVLAKVAQGDSLSHASVRYVGGAFEADVEV